MRILHCCFSKIYLILRLRKRSAGCLLAGHLVSWLMGNPMGLAVAVFIFLRHIIVNELEEIDFTDCEEMMRFRTSKVRTTDYA
jgi:hypothetical protein